MIPSSWYRRLAMTAIALLVAGILMWVASRMVDTVDDRAYAQTVAGMIFLLTFYSSAPLVARFLAPKRATNGGHHARVCRALSSIPGARWKVNVYDHSSESAVGVGIVPQQSSVYVTSSMMESLSDTGLLGVLGHEFTHIQRFHILQTFVYACGYALLAHYFNSGAFFLLGFLGFMALRRFFEYEADAGGANMVGREAMEEGLLELHKIVPTRWWSRFFVFAAPYPTMPMRLAALRTGRRVMF